ncbi:conserved hypothetical protein [Candidatus Sulfobium mesophilum]|uniref:ABC transporter substrate binding protein n=1 Tax=Candidatus Sulfobium mesophilum TaxID=2016548 RepID=A0A2U3QHM7_9BACT|nr:conserved hypothetical protein [Candidatus Sulfobium mesophilum]
MIGNIYKASFALLLIFISLSILSCRRQPVEKKYVIGVINLNPTMSSMVEGFKDGLAEKGCVEGKNVTYMQLKDLEDIDRVLRDLKVRKADLILAVTTPAMEKAQNAVRGTGIPIVGISFDPVRGGIVDSMAYKKENTTGIRVGGGVKKALEWLLLIAPHTKRVFVPVKFDTSAAESRLADLKDIATILNIDLLISNIEGRDDLRTALSSIPKDIDAEFIPHSLLIVSNLDAILETAVKRRLPTASGSGLYKYGVTVSCGQDHGHTGKQAAELANKVLKGRPAASLPFEAADLFLGINLDNAKKIGLDIPEHFLRQAEIMRQPAGAANEN